MGSGARSETCECVRKAAITANDSRGSAVKIALVLGREPRLRPASPLRTERDATTHRGILTSGAEQARRQYNPTCVETRYSVGGVRRAQINTLHGIRLIENRNRFPIALLSSRFRVEN